MIKEFNRKNLNAFADYLYKETAKEIEYVPLACGSLIREYDNEIYCCVLGEMYEYFFGRPVFFKELNNDVSSLLPEISNCNLNKITELSNALVNLSVINDDMLWEFIDDEKLFINRAKKCAKECKKIAKRFLK